MMSGGGEAISIVRRRGSEVKRARLNMRAAISYIFGVTKCCAWPRCFVRALLTSLRRDSGVRFFNSENLTTRDLRAHQGISSLALDLPYCV